ncbi:hypothetical protein [Pseudonocardia sp. NPDC046786]|uniref:hypothetical protein n=1 Tax=Pseudonocardia sp. NPDC046786 TaxID=3155471 RepID=UPI0033CDD866
MSAAATDPVDVARAAVEHAYEQGWTDGLPVVPVTAATRDEFLAATRRDPAEVIVHTGNLGRECTVEQVAVNAAMAGCRPEYMPVVLAAWDALMAQRIVTSGGWQSTSGPAPVIVVNGDVRGELGINSVGGVVGPGFRANATIARAIGLTVRNVLGIRPHELDQATQGLPGRFSICIGENEEESPWAPLSVDLGAAPGAGSVSAMLIRTCEFVDNRDTTDPEDLLRDIADTVARTGAVVGARSSAGLLLGIEHATMLADGGFGKADVAAWVCERAVRTAADLRAVGKGRAAGAAADDTRFPLVPGPGQFPIVVTGARNAGMSLVVRPFGFGGWSGTHPVDGATA